MPEARVPKKTSSKRHELGREAPMIITPAALLRLIRRIRGRGTKRSLKTSAATIATR